MVYDTNVHIPSKVDQLISMIDNYQITLKNEYKISSDRLLDTLMSLERDDGFKKDIKSYMTDYEMKIKEIKNTQLKQLHGVKSFEDGIRVIDTGFSRVNETTVLFWDVIKKYVIGYYKQIQPIEQQDEPGEIEESYEP